MLLEPIFTIAIDSYVAPGLPDQVRIQFNSDTGQFFYIRNNASTALLLERIARMCLSAWVDEHRDLSKEGPGIEEDIPDHIDISDAT
jgi:hypothetical protein